MAMTGYWYWKPFNKNDLFLCIVAAASCGRNAIIATQDEKSFNGDPYRTGLQSRHYLAAQKRELKIMISIY